MSLTLGKTWSRRSLLGAAVGAFVGGVSSQLSRPVCAMADEGRAPVRKGPRYVLHLVLRGGVDAIWTMDPRTRGDVSAGVDVPYDANAIIGDGVAFGPHLAPLRRWLPKACVVRGVRMGTANHVTGAIQVLRCKVDARIGEPTLLEIIGARRDRQALGTVTFGGLTRHFYSGGFFDGSLFDTIDRAAPSELHEVATVMRHQGAGFGARSFGLGRPAARVNEAAELLDGLATVRPFQVEEWSKNGDQQRLATAMQRAVWLFQHDLCRCSCVVTFNHWDTHTMNTVGQEDSSGIGVPMLARLLDALDHTVSGGRSLLDQTLVIAGSELGRYPMINAMSGKDHFPEAPMLLWGHGVAEGTSFGVTGKSLEALRVSPARGTADAGGVAMNLTDVGSTILDACGITGSSRGYVGTRLGFLQ
jgi:hypothetical protein